MRGKPVLKLVRLALLASMLAGCIPYPHTTLRSCEVSGRVVDARTHAPIPGARICLQQRPSISCSSDATGHFQLKATHNFHLARVLVGAEGFDWPIPKYYDTQIVSHPGYLPHVLCFTDQMDEILLEPVP